MCNQNGRFREVACNFTPLYEIKNYAKTLRRVKPTIKTFFFRSPSAAINIQKFNISTPEGLIPVPI